MNVEDANPDEVWEKFIRKLKENTLCEEDCRPINGQYHGLYVLRPEFDESRKALYDLPVPNWVLGEDKIIFFVEAPPHFARPLRFDFACHDSQWKICWVEQMTIPISSVLPLPFSDFPEMDQTMMAFSHADMYYTQKAVIFRYVMQKEGKDAAFAFFEDNLGYHAGVWLPYFREEKSLIVTLAWIEKNLNHEDVLLEKFSDEICSLRYRKHVWFRHYRASTHMRNIISEDDHKRLFEYVWEHRVFVLGWNVEFSYEEEDTIVKFIRK